MPAGAGPRFRARFRFGRFSRNCLGSLWKKSRRWFDAWFRASLQSLVEYLGRFLFGNSLKNALQRAPMPTAPPCSDGVCQTAKSLAGAQDTMQRCLSSGAIRPVRNSLESRGQLNTFRQQTVGKPSAKRDPQELSAKKKRPKGR